jgi:hypothetical protein
VDLLFDVLHNGVQVGPDICGYLDTAMATAEMQGFKGTLSTKDKMDAVLDDAGYEQLCNRWVPIGRGWGPLI